MFQSVISENGYILIILVETLIQYCILGEGVPFSYGY